MHTLSPQFSSSTEKISISEGLCFLNINPLSLSSISAYTEYQQEIAAPVMEYEVHELREVATATCRHWLELVRLHDARNRLNRQNKLDNGTGL